MLTILTVIIGIVFILLLLSLLASTIMEMMAAILSLRGKHLLNTLQNMLGDKLTDFLKHPFFRQLSYASHNKPTLSFYSLPSWLSKGTFSTIVADLLQPDPGKSLEQKIQSLPDQDLKNVLLFLLHQTDGSMEGFRAKLEYWFSEVMDRASDWYTRSTKWWLFGIGFVMAVILNADTIQIYQSLSVNAAAREQIEKMAEIYVQKHDSVPTLNLNAKKPADQSMADLQDLVKSYRQSVQSPLGLGWNEQQVETNTLYDWLIKFIGFILTGIAVTFGAPFWFDVLKKLISIRGGGAPPPPPPAAAPAQNQDAQG